MILLDPLAAIRHFESGDRYTIGYGDVSLKPFPLDQHGFPIWPGVWTKWGLTHAAGAYQDQPSLWHYYAAMLDIRDFSVASQDAVNTMVFRHEGFHPWAPYDARLAAFIVSKGGPRAFALGGANPFP